MSSVKSERWVVARRGKGEIDEDKDFRLESFDIPPLGDGEVRVSVVYASCDPTQLNWTRQDSYVPAIPVGEVVLALSMGIVMETKSDKFAVGDRVSGRLGFQRIWQGKATNLQPVPAGINMEDALCIFCHIGATAWAFVDIGQPKAGETVVVTGAAGAVGSLVVQIAKAKGCRVVGIAGTAAKLEVVTELGADAAINYKDETFADQLMSACPKGIDIYFENVGGKITEAAWPMLNTFARVVACGMISTYKEGGLGAESPSIPLYSAAIVTKRLKIQGFICSDFVDRWGSIFKELGAMMAEGKLKARIDVVDGFENAIKALAGLFTGENIGKRVVKFCDAPAL